MSSGTESNGLIHSEGRRTDFKNASGFRSSLEEARLREADGRQAEVEALTRERDA